MLISFDEYLHLKQGVRGRGSLKAVLRNKVRIKQSLFQKLNGDKLDDAFVAQLGERNRGRVFVFLEGGEVVGAVVFRDWDRGVVRRNVFLKVLLVHPDFRGRGYGRRILGELVEHLSRNTTRLEIGIVLKAVRSAVGFWGAMGFSRSGCGVYMERVYAVSGGGGEGE